MYRLFARHRMPPAARVPFRRTGLIAKEGMECHADARSNGSTVWSARVHTHLQEWSRKRIPDRPRVARTEHLVTARMSATEPPCLSCRRGGSVVFSDPGCGMVCRPARVTVFDRLRLCKFCPSWQEASHLWGLGVTLARGLILPCLCMFTPGTAPTYLVPEVVAWVV